MVVGDYLETEMEPSLTLDELKRRLCYCPLTGSWTRVIIPKKLRRSAHNKVGYVSKTSGGYRLIKIDDKVYKSSRLAFFYMTGRWPEPEVDHKNRDPLDDKWTNLVESTRKQNNLNRRPFSEWKGTPFGRSR